MIERNEILSEREVLLSNAAFQRFASGFDLYQKLLGEKPDARDEIRNRMRTIHVDGPKSYLGKPESEEKNMVEPHIALSEDVLRQCEEGRFTPKGFADALLSSKYGRIIIRELSQKRAGEVDEASGMVYVNDAMRYHFDDENQTQISLHIDPIDASTVSVLGKIKEGLMAVATQLEKNEIPATQVSMTSWLISPKLAERLLGKDIEVQMGQNPYDALPALKFNQKKLEAYLTTGEFPLIGKIVMTKEEFINRIRTTNQIGSV